MKIPVFIFAKYDDYDKRYSFHAWGFDMAGNDVGQLIEKMEVEIDTPPHDVLVQGTISEYREQQKKIMADAYRKRQEIEERIKNMLSIEYKAESAL